MVYSHYMARYYHGVGLIVMITLFFCFFFLPLRSNYLPNSMPLPAMAAISAIEVKFQEIKNGFWFNSNESLIDASLINAIVKRQLAENEQNLVSYEFHPGLGHVSSVQELIPAYGGNPVRNMVITTWRSGSTFLGDLMQSHPASFYHYEPLLPYGIKRLRNGALGAMALNDLEKLMLCNYTNMDHFTNYAKSHVFLLSHNKPVWDSCQEASEHLCFNPTYLAKMCEIFPFQNIKTVRLQTTLVDRFLQDPRLRLRVLLLVRDPRGTIQSRQHRDWCPGEPDCEDPSLLCKDLEIDYKKYKEFSKQYPKTFKVIRYEDLSLDIYNKSREIFDFFRLMYHEDVGQFLDTHTKESKGGVSSTFRDSKTAPIHWRSDLTWERIQTIQKKCRKALKLWGYNLAHNASHATTFNPIGKFHGAIK